ncbi:hypothetical protein TomMM35A_03620 [Sphingobium sp. TomMM35A]
MVGMLQTSLEPFDALALGWISADFRGRLIIDSLYHIQWWNDEGRRAIEASEILREEAGQLVVDASLRTKFSSFLSDLKSQTETGILTVKDGDGHFVMFGHHEPSTGMFCLEVSCSHAEKRIMFADFGSIYGLTESETQAALALFRGKTVVEIAQDRNVSVDTVRTQVRKLYGKIGAQSREKLFKMLMPFRIT